MREKGQYTAWLVGWVADDRTLNSSGQVRLVVAPKFGGKVTNGFVPRPEAKAGSSSGSVDLAPR